MQEILPYWEKYLLTQSKFFNRLKLVHIQTNFIILKNLNDLQVSL